MGDILIIDNYDSFTYNLVHLVEKLLHTKVDVRKNDEVTIAEVKKYGKIILSPGPGIPKEAGVTMEVIKVLAPFKSILGVCLGHQAIGEVFGAQLENLKDVFHGVATKLTITEAENPIFKGLDAEEWVGRYHSWIVSKNNLPEALKVTAEDEFGNIMGIRHQLYDVQGLQFHPESILTPNGIKILQNWLFK
jgi:anthranilate synthase component 2